ncbi:DUF3159 domain-containing protein [Saccharomonospora viridis]|uniref:DUF3159 domain-containing protein n=3 Tax=Saccharomonospora viridis TaxID=1852 RepID=C7MYJ9_SACVD|nr:hypothetical protein Svir_24230 [Saccharomonospora viridis DSM 43017]KHF43753.1 membrane protein [Saccharomonospora viridis]SFP84644.1 Protein of unknown function [Saccharomonospora viridis]
MTEHSEQAHNPGNTDRDTVDDDRREDTPGKPDPQEATLLEQMGGVSGLFYSSIPVVVFVAVNAMFGLMPAIWSALGSAVVITVVRVVRKEPVQPAVSGFFGVAIAAFIAYNTGSAKGFFLFGIWTSLVYFAVLAGSVVVRWPLAGVVWSFLNGSGMAWRKDKPSRRGYDIATLALAAVFASRFVVQRWLYDEDLTGWLAFAKIVMGYPLYGLALLVVVWAVRRSDRRLQQLAEHTEQRVETDEEIEARLRAKYAQPPSAPGTGDSGTVHG